MMDTRGPGSSSQQQSPLKTEPNSKSPNTLKALLLFKTRSSLRGPTRIKFPSPVKMRSPSKALSSLKPSSPSKRLSSIRNPSPFKKSISPKRPDFPKRQISSQRSNTLKTSERSRPSESKDKSDLVKKASPKMKLFHQWRHLKMKLVKKVDPPSEVPTAVVQQNADEYLVPVEADITVDSFSKVSSPAPIWATLPYLIQQIKLTRIEDKSSERNNSWPHFYVPDSFVCPVPAIMAPSPPSTESPSYEEQPPPGLVRHPDCSKRRSPSTCPSSTKGQFARKSLTSTNEIESLHITADDSSWLDKRLEVPRAFVVVTPPAGLTLHPDASRKPSPPRRPRSPQNFPDSRAERRARQRAQDVADGYFWPEDTPPAIEVSPASPVPLISPDPAKRQSTTMDLDNCSTPKSRSSSIDSQSSFLIPSPSPRLSQQQSDVPQTEDNLTRKQIVTEEPKPARFTHTQILPSVVNFSSSRERTPKYMLLGNEVLEYVDGEANYVEWPSVLYRRAEETCRLVVPLHQSTGLYVVGYETRKNRLKIESFWYEDRFHKTHCEVLSVTRNYLYAVDSARAIRRLADQNGRRLMDPIRERISDEFDEVFNITQNDNLRFFVYGKIRGQKTVKFIDNGPPLIIENVMRLNSCLDIVHIPFTKTIYLVWCGHIEVIRTEVADTLIGSGYNVHFLPRRMRVEQVLYPFSDSRGLVIHARNTWSQRDLIICYNIWTSRWRILKHLDIAEIDREDNVPTKGDPQNLKNQIEATGHREN